MNKKAYYFTLDAFIALIIILSVLMIVKPFKEEIEIQEAVQEDLISSLSSLQMYEIDNDYAKQLISEEKASENNTILEQIVELHAKSLPEAKEFSENILNSLNTKTNMGIWFNNELIASKNSSSLQNSTEVWTSRQLVSGIQKGNDTTAFSSRAFLTKSDRTKYFYFGGYVGDGNISLLVNYTGTIKDAELEIAINNDFDVYINNVFSGHYENSTSDLHPAKYSLDSYLSRFNSGENMLKITKNSSGENLYVSGGYLKITYNSSLFVNESEKYSFPGIEGLINLYDGFYIPQNLSGMEIFLHYYSNKSVFLIIGNTTVFNSSSPVETQETISNSELSSLLDYDSLTEKTIPLRLGMENVTYMTNLSNYVDVFSVTDLSGSMEDGCYGGGGICCFIFGCGNEQGCLDCGGTWEEKLTLAKQANKEFVNSILNLSGNRVGLTAYRGSISDPKCHDLSSDNESLILKIDDWTANGGTCICCGIERAILDLTEQSSDDKIKVMVVMSDGEANYDCEGDYGASSAKQAAINKACEAYEDYDITVHAVGFGEGADESTLQSIADCGNGDYYYSDIENITDLYNEISKDIIEASYSEQTIEIQANLNTKLYPDSYIIFDYNKTSVPYGLIATSETNIFGNDISEGNFSIPENSTPLNAKAISYSGSKWTQNVKILNNGSWKNIFNLSRYGSKYIKLGDPYSINIPTQNISVGENKVKITTALNPSNISGGSSSNKVIYQILKQALSYSPILASASGCNWTVEFYDSSTLSFTVPKNYSGTSNCHYTSETIAYNENDAIEYSIHELLSNLDLNSDGKIDTKFSEDSFEISSSEISGIPYTYSSEVQVRIWK